MTNELTMSVARKGYESYCAHTDNRSVVTGAELPKWESLPDAVVAAWCAAVEGIIEFLASLHGKVVVYDNWEDER